MNLTEKAIQIAVLAHGQQKRKTDDMLYFVHPIMTALKLYLYNFPEKVVAAGLIHDVLEDTDYPEDRLRQELGDEVVDIIIPVTENKSLEWEDRKQRYIEAVKNAPWETKAVSIADRIHNLETLLAVHAKQGPAMWQKFTRGRDKKVWMEKELLKMFKHTWKNPMIDEYEKLVKQMEKLD